MHLVIGSVTTPRFYFAELASEKQVGQVSSKLRGRAIVHDSHDGCFVHVDAVEDVHQPFWMAIQQPLDLRRQVAPYVVQRHRRVWHVGVEHDRKGS